MGRSNQYREYMPPGYGFLSGEDHYMTSTKKNPSITDLVCLAAKWLDRNVPGWHDKVTCGDIDIRSCDACILGQLHRAGVNLERRFEPIGIGGKAFHFPEADHDVWNQTWRNAVSRRQWKDC